MAWELHAYGTVPLAYPSTRRDHDAFTQLRWKTGGAYSRSCCRTYAIAFHPPSSNSLRITIPRYIRQYSNIVVTTPLTTGRVVCVMISYGHFFIEHNRGHHKLVKAPCLPPFFCFVSAAYGQHAGRFQDSSNNSIAVLRV